LKPKTPRKKPAAKAAPASPPRLKTLDRMLSKAGIASRTETREWIARGRLKVNGKTVRDPETWVNPERDKILFDGKPLQPPKKMHLVLYKPKGYITSYKDPDGRPTVYDLLDGFPHYVVPVGRLDQDTSGLLLMTNDTEFAEHITNPAHHVPKTYLVKASALLTEEQLDQLRHGLELKDGPTRPATVKFLRHSARATFFEITIREGRNRQVRRMVEALGAQVLKLVRIAIGPLRIGALNIGRYRALTPDEIRLLRRAGAPPPAAA
jgi:23S rRNA pseudouridine2605 synthase